MSTLQAEFHRLYLPTDSPIPGHDSEGPRLMTSDGRVRAMVLELGRPADWGLLSAMWQGVQADLGLPAPAIAVSGIDSYQLWFSLLQPISAAQAWHFLDALRLRYLNTVPVERIGLLPSVDAALPHQILHARPVPALQQENAKWSAFVAPDLAAIFSEEPWLDLPPSEQAQASVLSRLKCMTPDDFQAALNRVQAVTETATAHAQPSPAIGAASKAHPDTHACGPDEKGLDPKQFLLGVMRDPTIELSLRIEAAKALLPYP